MSYETVKNNFLEFAFFMSRNALASGFLFFVSRNALASGFLFFISPVYKKPGASALRLMENARA